MACNMISCIEVAEITQTLKIADFTMKSRLRTLKITVYWGRGIASPSPLNRYGIYWMVPGESLCPDGSEYVWQRGVGGV